MSTTVNRLMIDFGILFPTHNMSHYHTEMNLTGSHKQELGSGYHQLS